MEPRLDGLLAATGPQDGAERYFWGVDPSTVRVSVGIVSAGGELAHVQTHSFTRHDARSLERLRCIHAETDSFFRKLATRFPPVHVLVEEPAGKDPNPQLHYAVGCILACVPIVGAGALVPISSWKLEATGHGYMPGIPPAPREASKPEKAHRQRERRAAEKARLLKWARRHGYEGQLEDEADAVGIAFACRSLRSVKPEQLALA